MARIFLSLGLQLLLVQLPFAAALDNGVAKTPPLGWCSWQRYRCAIGCNDATSPECFNEGLIKRTADAMVSEGYLAAGYEYVALDDCWQANQRSSSGHLVSDPKRFPSGIKALADYVHGKGLKFGLYTALGNVSCAVSHRAGYSVKSRDGLGCDEYSMPGCVQAKRDIDDMVSWGIDHLKVDGCYQFDRLHMNGSYAIVGGFLREAAKAAGRAPVVYHPSNLGFKFPRQFRELAAIGNQWRFFNDVDDSWLSVKGILDQLGAGQPECIPGPLPANCTSDAMLESAKSTYCASYCVERDQFRGVAGRGGWHDPDMILVGQTNCSASAQKDGMHCGALTHDEEQLQMAIWAMSSAPLLMSTDVAAIGAESKKILLNKGVLAINQDPLGRMPFRYIIDDKSGAHLWRKELVGGDVALAIVNYNDDLTIPAGFSVELIEAGFSTDTRVSVRDVYKEDHLGWHTFTYKTARAIPPHGVILLRLSYSPQYTAEREL